MNFEVDFDYSVPEWTTITVANAKDKADAEDIAQNEFDNMYPEAIDVRMTDVREIASSKSSTYVEGSKAS